MTLRPVVVLFAKLLLLFPLLGQDSVFRVDVGLVRLLATVKTTDGALVGDLEKENFTILDSGVKQEIAVFERRTEQPLSVALLVDTSASTATRLSEETASVLGFLDALFAEGNPNDSVTLYSFNHDVTLQSGYTRRLPRIEAKLENLQPEAGTSLYDAVYFAARSVATREGRRVIVVVTDGADTTSVKSFHDALEAAHNADAILYGIMVIPVASDAGRHIAGENALISLATGTGGRAIAASLGDMLDSAFSSIVHDLRTQYFLGYYPRRLPYSKDRFRRVTVTVDRPDLRVITRTGYYEEYEDSGRGASPLSGPMRQPRQQE